MSQPGRPRRRGFTMIELLSVIAIISVLIALLLPAVQAAREQARRVQCTNNMMQLVLAVENYEASHRVYPPGVVDAAGPIRNIPRGYHVGWIVQILPQIGQGNLYDRVDFGRSIYDVRNTTVFEGLSLMTLMCPSSRSSGGISSSYAACHHDAEAPIAADNRGVFFLNSRVRPDEVTDGLAQTIFLGERQVSGWELGWYSGTRSSLRNTGFPPNHPKLSAFDALLTKSEFDSPDREVDDPGASDADLKRREQAEGGAAAFLSVGGFGSVHPFGANFAFGDGSVRFLTDAVSPRVFRLLGARGDGEPVDADAF